MKAQSSVSFLQFCSLLMLLFFSAQCSSLSHKDKTEFSYQKIEKETYQDGMGGVIPLTMENGEAYGGWITPDQKYLVFTSNRSGNFDIYVRALNDIDIFPITSLPSNQIEPTMSPDGKKLAYIDDELDPDGDLIVQAFNPPASYRSQKTTGREFTFRTLIEFFFKTRKNLTNSEKQRVRSAESNPAWSPDSKQIVFSSDMTSFPGSPLGPGIGAVQNLWLLDVKKPKNARRLTQKGGVMPSFSPDGKKIVYVSYEVANQNGDIFELDIESGQIHALTNSIAMELSPVYTLDGKGIIFTRIDEDSNGDGSIDRKDNGVIFLQDLKTSRLTRLSYSALNLFDTHLSKFQKGSILLSFAQNESINVGYIPLQGIIPQKADINTQLIFSEQYNDQWYHKNFPEYSQNKITEPYLMAIDRISLFFPQSSQYVVLSALKDFSKLNYLETHNLKKQAMQLRQEILQKIKNQENFYRIYLDLQTLRSGQTSWTKLPLLVQSRGSTANYLRKIISKPSLYLAYYYSKKKAKEKSEKINRKSIDSLKANPYSMVLPYLMDMYGKELQNEGRNAAAAINHSRLLKSYPEYFRIGEILLEQGSQKDLSNNGLPQIAREFLWLLYPKQYSDKEFLKHIQFPSLQDNVKRILLDDFVNLTAHRKFKTIQTLREKYPQSSYPEVHYLSFLGAALQYLKEENSQEATKQLEKVKSIVPTNSYWQFLYYIYLGKSYELQRDEQQAIAQYSQALSLYLPAYNYSEVDSLLQRVNSHYLASAQAYLSRSEFFNAWGEYKNLLEVYQNLHNHNVKNENISASAVAAYMSVDELAFMNFEKDPKIMRAIENFYGEHIGEARSNLNHPFIFGRGYLYTQLGIYLHRKFEAQPRGILHVQKKKILKLFKSAQRDFEWSFMANRSFVDSYIMLGWMYQYIDEKREQKIASKNNRKDKEIFRKLYSSYFPRYLFEENIRIYQNSIANLQNKISDRVLINFHLNMANNYYLLNNFGKAEENYRFVENNLEKGYRFENDTQKALFYFNMGKTLFFTGKYSDSYENLNKSYELYKILAPIDTDNIEDNQRNQNKRELILQYRALTSQYNSDYQNSLLSYQTILNEQEQTQTQNPKNNSAIYLEMARLNKELANASKEPNYYYESLKNLATAEEALKNEKTIKPPRMPIRLRFLGITIPVGGKKMYDKFFIGENRLPFLLPSLQRIEYLASIRADVYRGLGLLFKAENSLQNLQEHCQNDHSKHGKECLMSSYMRLGYTRYQNGNMIKARETYEQAVTFARAQKDLESELKARKNLLAISAYELENKEQSVQEKIKTIEKEKKDLQSFQEQYIEESLQKAEAALKKKNKKLTLSEEEKDYLQERKMKEIYPLLLYQGIFDAYLSEIQETESRQKTAKTLDYSQYLQAKQKNVSNFFSALETLLGNVRYKNKSYNYLDKSKDRKKNLILALNRARVYQKVGFYSKAQEEYAEAARKADEFQAALPYAVAWYGLLQTDYNFEDNLALSDSLEKSFALLSQNQTLAQNYPQVYKEILSGYSTKAIQKKDYASALMLENSKRHFSAWNSIRHQFPILKNQNGKLISRYRQLEVIESSLQNKISDLRFQRKDTKAIEKYLEQVSGERQKLYKSLTTSPSATNISRVMFSNTLSKEDLAEIITPFVYINRNQNNYSFWYSEGWSIQYKEFKITNKEINTFKELLLKKDDKNSATANTKAAKTKVGFTNSANAKTEEDKTTSQTEQEKQETPAWVLWLQEKNPALIFPDTNFWDFPFEKILAHPYLRSSTFEATLMFQKNNSLSFERWLQAGHNSSLFSYSAAGTDNKKNIKEQKDWQQFALWSDALDYQSKLSFSNRLTNQTTPQLTEILNSDYTPTVAVLTNEKDASVNSAHLQDYAAGSELLLAAQGVSLNVFSKQSRSQAENDLQKLFKNSQPQFSSSLAINGNPLLFYAWLDSNIPFAYRKKTLQMLSQEQFQKYYTSARQQYQNEQYDSALQAMERANFALVRQELLENAFYVGQEAFKAAIPIHYLNSEQFNFKNDILFALKDTNKAEDEYIYKLKQVSPPVSTNIPLGKEEVARKIFSDSAKTKTAENNKSDKSKQNIKESIKKRNTTDTTNEQETSATNLNTAGKDLLFAYGNRLIRFQYIKEGIEKIQPLRSSLTNTQLYLLSESFFLSQSLSGKEENLKNYDPLLQQYIQKIGFPTDKDMESKIDFFLGKTKRTKEWLQVLYQGLYWKRYADLFNATTVPTSSNPQKLVWTYTYLPYYVNIKEQPLFSSFSSWLSSLKEISTLSPSFNANAFTKYTLQNKNIFTENLPSVNKLFSEALWHLQSTPSEKDTWDDVANKAIATFEKVLAQSNELTLYDAVLLTLWQKIEKRDIPATALQKLISFLAKTATNAQKKIDMGTQRKIFYVMLAQTDAVMKDPMRLQNSLSDYSGISLSSFNRSLYNHILFFAAGYQPQLTANMAYQNSNLYFQDKERILLFNQLQLVDLFYKNSDAKSLTEILAKALTPNHSSSQELNLYLTYFIAKRDYTNALQWYLKNQKQNIRAWQLENPLLGIMPTFPYTWYSWKWSKDAQPNITSLSVDSQGKLNFSKNKENAFLFLPTNDKRLRQTLLTFPQQSIYITNLNNFTPVASERKSTKLTVSWSAQDKVEANFLPLFYANLGKASLHPETSLLYISAVEQSTTQTLRLQNEVRIISENVAQDPLLQNDRQNLWKIYYSGQSKDKEVYFKFLDFLLEEFKQQKQLSPVNAFWLAQKKLYDEFPQLKTKNSVWMYR